MKQSDICITITDDIGIVLESIKLSDIGNIDKPLPAALLLEQIRAAVARKRIQENQAHGY